MKDENLYKRIDLSKLTFSEKPVATEEALKDVNPFFETLLERISETIENAKGNIDLKSDVQTNGARPE